MIRRTVVCAMLSCLVLFVQQVRGETKKDVPQLGATLYQKQVSLADAGSFAGIPDENKHVCLGKLADAKHLEFAKKLLEAWGANDSEALQKLVSPKTLKVLKSSGHQEFVSQWTKGMAVHLIPARIKQPKVFVTQAPYDPNDPSVVAQAPYFNPPAETPTTFIVLYTYDEERDQVFGRQLLVVQDDSNLKLTLQTLKPPPKQSNAEPTDAPDKK